MLDFLASNAAVPVALVVVLVLAIVVLVLVIWSIRRHRDPQLEIDCDAPLTELMPSLSGLTQGTVYEGNAVELLENGAFFDAMFEEIRARHALGALRDLPVEGRRARAAPRRRAGRAPPRRRAGARAGRRRRRQEDGPRRGSAGCATPAASSQLHHPRHLRNIGVFNERDHRKLVVLDGRVALVGGHCIVDSWLGDAQDRDHVRDLGVRVRGPVVHAVQAAFSENWVEDTGELFVGDDAFPSSQPMGDVAVHVASIKPEGSAPAVKILHHLVVCVARKRIRIQNPYFLPDDEAIEALCAGGRSAASTCASWCRQPKRRTCRWCSTPRTATSTSCSRGGVRIFEYQKCLLHQKVMTVDGVWCAIGSSNFDDRSFETNDEITLGLRRRRAGAASSRRSSSVTRATASS